MSRFLLLFVLLAASPAHAEWWEARTDNFIVYSESSGADAKTFAEKLQRFEMSLRSLQNIKPGAAPTDVHRLTVFRFGDVEDIAQLHGSAGVAGFYIPRLTGPVAFTPARSETLGVRSLRLDGGTELDPQTVLFHEYAHHFMFKHFTAAYPAWYIEGLAETYSTIDLKADGSFHLGNPPQSRGAALFGGLNYSVKRLLTNRRKPTMEDFYAAYSHGWLLTHYLTFEPSRNGQLKTYLRLVNQGADTATAARQAFGDLDQLENQVIRYKGLARAGKLPGALVRASFAPPTATLRRLGPDEEAIMRVRMRSARGVGKARRRDVAGDARAVAARFPSSFPVQQALAKAELGAQNLDAAERAARAALAIRPASAAAHYYLGQIYLERAKSNPKHFATARSWFVKANRADPNDPGSLLGYYLTYSRANAPIPELAVIGLERAFDMAPYDSELRVILARQLLGENKLDVAHMVLVPLALSPHESKRARALNEVVELIEAGKGAEALARLDERMRKDEEDKKKDD